MEQLLKNIKEAGASNAAVIEVKDITFRPEFRDACKQNFCGKYNTNWGCPPACGTIEDMMAQAQSYPYALVYQTVSLLEDSFDYEGMQSLTIEARQKLGRVRPATIGQASRIPGVSPADINVLLVKFGR